MKPRGAGSLAMAILLGLGCAAGHANLKPSEPKVSGVDAEKIALAKVPNGTVTEREFEKEDGRLVWSFDIALRGTSDVTEVQVDAMTGEVVSIEKETVAQQQTERDAK